MVLEKLEHASAGHSGQFCIGKSDGNYANPKNAYTFYSCSNGLTYLMDCPSGLIFRESLNICVWPTTEAPNTTTQTPPTTTSAAPIDEFCKGKRDGHYANPKNAYTFYSCSNGLTYLMDCPSASAVPLDQFCAVKKNGDYANPNNPNSYISCFDGVTYIRYCPTGLIFVENSDKCDWPTNTGSVVVTTPSPVPTTTPFGFDAKFCSGKRDGDYTFPYNGHKFYTCSNGLTSIRDCPSNLIFKKNLNQCDWA
ncbi:hypothetical protein Q5P01_009418 [Channa striata]|uniref:chitinase n=1 Tax=Channa striata TaxID=64152 RepID=A0AA88N4A3_CHASR|nr:hypothetical protein Q5P01_009418 [Channa striata]